MNADLPLGSLLTAVVGWNYPKPQAPDAHLEEEYENRTLSDLD
jgi:hypothetical protein